MAHFDRLPRVTVQLPLYNERYVLERLIDEVVKIEYPRELLQIQVLDDSDPGRYPSIRLMPFAKNIATWGIRSSICTAPAAKGSKPAHCRKAAQVCYG